MSRADADFTGSGTLTGSPNILWNDTSNNALYAWTMNTDPQTATVTGTLHLSEPGAVASKWQPVGTPDLNGDGQPDLLWRDTTTGDLAVWYMSGNTRLTTATIATAVPLDYKLVATPDLNGDGKPDIVWQQASTGQVSVWYMNGATLTGTAIVSNSGTVWQLAGVADLNGDGKTDFVWRNSSTGEVDYWLLNGLTLVGSGMIANPGTGWQVKGVADLNADGEPDILLQSGGNLVVWYLSNSASGIVVAASPTLATGLTANYQMVGMGGNGVDLTLHLADLSLNPGSTLAGTSATGTLNLSSPAPAVGATVTLKSNNTAVGVPGSVAVMPGSKTATFPVSNAVSAVSSVTVSGKLGGWTQAADFVALPGNYSLTVQNLLAVAGNGCIVLSWKPLPSKSIRGYNIYRDGATTPLNASPVAANLYADIQTAASGAHAYVVKIVNLAGQVVNASAAVNATANASGPKLSWITPPSSSVVFPGVVVPQAILTGGTSVSTVLMVDGKDVETAHDFAELYPTLAGKLSAELNTSSLANGTHNVQMIGYTQTAVFATTPLTLQTRNNYSNFNFDAIVNSVTGSVVNYNVTLPPTTQRWKVTVTNPSTGVTLASWKSSGSVAHLAFPESLWRDPKLGNPPADPKIDIQPILDFPRICVG